MRNTVQAAASAPSQNSHSMGSSRLAAFSRRWIMLFKFAAFFFLKGLSRESLAPAASGRPKRLCSELALRAAAGALVLGKAELLSAPSRALQGPSPGGAAEVAEEAREDLAAAAAAAVAGPAAAAATSSLCRGAAARVPRAAHPAALGVA